MYDVLLVLHSINRWLVLASLVVAVARGARGWRARAAWTQTDERVGRLTAGAADFQMLLGLLLYVIFSPYTRAAFADIGIAMADDTLRFWLAEHGPVMLAAVVLVHIGRTRSEHGGPTAAGASGEPADRAWHGHRTVVLWFGAGLLIILAAIPWPFLQYGRRLLPGL